MGKLEINKKQKKDALLESAFSLFTSKGIQKTSISDIVEKSGVAKGTFYLYFKDKYDIRNMLISHKASRLFHNADQALMDENIDNITERIIFLADHIINQLCENKVLLSFISKNLSWGIFKSALITPGDDSDINFYNIYQKLIYNAECQFKDPEIMVFMLIELISSTCYSSILYDEPVPIDKLKPYLFDSIRDIINRHKTEDNIIND
ncbi:MAG: TetR/AcrR family transcriptional regulator [Lachnospiraceae bacterium]|nr:TetR/AcrR family transcriptional regulator [Lachnospiraceae bacterium]MDE6251209.1 TetR/AcrR family transcriptional regulator [Lachnospiraceae bacterium]